MPPSKKKKSAPVVVSGAKPKASKVTKPRVAYYTFWMTRDADPLTGEPSPFVDLWYVRPILNRMGTRGVYWLDGSVSGLAHQYTRVTVAEAIKIADVVPDDGMQCIRVGPEHETREALTGITAVA